MMVAFLSQMSSFSRNLNHYWKSREEKGNFSLVIMFWNFTIFQYKSHSPKAKRNFISSIANLVYELLHELPNNSRLGILGKQERLEKSQIWVVKKPSAQSLLKKFYFCNNKQKSRKNGYQAFLFLSNITGFLYFASNILSGILVSLPFQNRKAPLKQHF